MIKHLLAAFLALSLVACAALSRQDEARLADLEVRNAQRTITEDEKEELKDLRRRAVAGGIDLNRLLEYLGVVVTSIVGTNIYRNKKRATRGEAV